MGLAEHTYIVAIGIGADGKKHVLGLREGATENAAVCRALLADLVKRGLLYEERLLVYWTAPRPYGRRCGTLSATTL